MDFYIDGGGGSGGYNVTVPTQIGDPAAVGLAGGGGLYPGQPAMPYGNYKQGDIDRAISSYNSLLSNQYKALMAANLPASSKYAIDLAYDAAKGQTSFNAYSGASNPYGLAFASFSDPNNAINAGKQYEFNRTLGVTDVNMPTDELGLLKEYSQDGNLSDYTNTAFSQPYSKDAYGAWLKNQQTQYQDAQKNENNLSIAVPGPWKPSGPVDAGSILSEELLKLYNADGHQGTLSDSPNLLPYNPLSSDWEGTADISGLAKMLAGLFVPHAKSPAAAKLFDSPTYGLLSTQSSETAKASDPLGATNLPWQPKNTIKPADYFDDTSKGIAQPTGLMGQEMVTQRNVLPQLQLDMQKMADNTDKNLSNKSDPLTSETKNLQKTDEKTKNALDKFKTGRLANWQSIA